MISGYVDAYKAINDEVFKMKQLMLVNSFIQI